MTAVIIWSFGLIAGCIVFFIAALIFVFKLFFQQKLRRKLPQFIKPKELSESIISEIRSNFESKNEIETAAWLNSTINWLFTNLMDSPSIQKSLQLIITEIVVDLRRTTMGLIFRDSEMISIEICGGSPIISNIKIITGSSLKDPSSAFPLTLQFNLEYEGLSRLLLSFDTIFDIKIETETILKAFKASICVVIQDRSLHFCLQKEPSILETSTKVFLKSSHTTSKESSRLTIPFVNSLFSGFLIKKVLGSTMIGPSFPNFFSQWYRAGPDQPPYPWHSEVLENPELLYTWKSKSDSKDK